MQSNTIIEALEAEIKIYSNKIKESIELKDNTTITNLVNYKLGLNKAIEIIKSLNS